jgi:hypothetical protein
MVAGAAVGTARVADRSQYYAELNHRLIQTFGLDEAA